MNAFARVRRVLEAATGTEFTGAVARIEYQGRLVFEEAFGRTRDDALAEPVYCDTLFDLASLTKLFVATLALKLVAEKRLDLDAPMARGITARMLLAHTSGMNSGADYRAILDQNVERFALESDLVDAPGARVIYSDLGFIALGAAIERIAGLSLQSFAQRHFAPPLLYRPRAAQRRWIPATEVDGWRGRVQGYVHDEKAYLMGGVAGHAGLFGTARDVAALAGEFLAPLRGRASNLLPPTLAREAVSEQAYDPVLRRGLGWALKTNDENSCGRLMDRSSFGHTGFVGTCVWADPVRDVQGVLLTNAVYFGRNAPPNPGPALRASFYEAMIEDLAA